MLTLYHSPQSRSIRPRWLLEEIGVPYEVKLIRLDAGEQKSPEYLKLNPNGTVPITIHAHLSTSNPAEPGNLTGIQELTFLGHDENRTLVELTVRVPLN